MPHVVQKKKASAGPQRRSAAATGPSGKQRKAVQQRGGDVGTTAKAQQQHPQQSKRERGDGGGDFDSQQQQQRPTMERREAPPRPRFVPGQVCNGLPYFKFWAATRDDMNAEAATVAEQRRAREEDTERTFSGMRVTKKRGGGGSGGRKGSSSSSGGGGGRMLFKTDKKGVNLVSALLHAHGFARTSSSKAAHVIWSFNRLQPSFHKSLERGQKINQFPKSMEITRKSALSQNVASMQQRFRGGHFDFIPKSFILPRDASTFKAYFAKHPGTPWIVKPAGGACGRNIFISDDVQEILNAGMSGTYLVDQYIANPLLVDGLKFDLRIYVGVASFYPLRVYVFEDGLARFATQPYSTNPESFKQAFIHLTNYSVNKYSENFVANEGEDSEGVGTKQSISALMPKLAALGVDCVKLWSSIDDLIIKTLLCIEPKVKQECDLSVGSSRSCFQLFGFDVLVDAALKPWLLEVNFTPSLAVDAPIDMRIKGNMLADLFTIAGIQPRKKASAGGGTSKKSGGGLSGAASKASAAAGGGGGGGGSGRGGMIQPPRESERQMRSAGLDGNLTSVERVVAARTADENARAGGFRRIYPNGEDAFFYSQFMERDRVLNFAITNFLFKQRVEAEQDAHIDALALGVMQKRYCRQREAEAAAAVHGVRKKKKKKGRDDTETSDGHSSARNGLTSASSSRSGGSSRRSSDNKSRNPTTGRRNEVRSAAVESKTDQPQENTYPEESAEGSQSDDDNDDDSEPEEQFRAADSSEAEENEGPGQEEDHAPGDDFGEGSSPEGSAGDLLNYTQFHDDDDAGNSASATGHDGEDRLDEGVRSDEEDIAAGISAAEYEHRGDGGDDLDAGADYAFGQSDAGVGDETGDYSAEYETEEEQENEDEDEEGGGGTVDDDREGADAGSALDLM